MVWRSRSPVIEPAPGTPAAPVAEGAFSDAEAERFAGTFVLPRGGGTFVIERHEGGLRLSGWGLQASVRVALGYWPPPKEELMRHHEDRGLRIVEQLLADNAAVLKKFDFIRITIEGHCDERGTVDYNLALGERRARAAFDYFTSLGIDPARMKVVSYGKEIPACQQSNEACWAQNRRDHFAVTGKVR